MATVKEAPKAASRHERFVQQEITRAVRRVRFLDLARAALGLAIAFMAYGLLMILADKWLNLSQTTRQVSLVGFLAVVAAYTWFILLRPIRRAINPYYAAVQVEQTIPDAKNSLVNWLDLHEDNLPPSVANALGQRAADDLKETDVQQAITSNSLIWLAGITLGLVVGFIAAILIMRTDQFNSLVSRVFSPFAGNRAIVKQTRISMVNPEGGDATLGVNNNIKIIVHIGGRLPQKDKPDSVRLLLRHNGDDAAYEEVLPLEPSVDEPTDWWVQINRDKIQNGFWYKVAAGDDETPEYRIAVHASPSITRFDVSLKYRPYTRLEPRRTYDANISDWRGTEVVLEATTNRQVRAGSGSMVLKVNGEAKGQSLPAELIPGKPEAMRFKFTLERDATYTINFKSTDGEESNNQLPYTIKVLQDQPPMVEFTEPVELKPDSKIEPASVRADLMLRLKGTATDDFGIRRMTLRMAIVQNEGRLQPLKPQEYLTEKDFRLDTGGWMRLVEYKDDVDMSKIEYAGGGLVKLETGDILEFWLEAEDNSDFAPGGRGQIGSTRHCRVKIIGPLVPQNVPPNDPDAKKNQDEKKDERDKGRKDAEREKKDHDQQHEKDRQKQSEDQRKAEEQRKREAKEQEDQKKNAERNGAPKPENNPKPDDAKKPDQNQNDTKQPDPKPEGSEKTDAQREQENKDKALEEAKNELKRQQEQSEKDQGKNGSDAKAQDKPAPPDKNNGKPDDAAKPNEGDAKNQPKPDMGDKNNPDNQPSEPKKGDQKQEGSGPGETKSSDPPKESPKSEEKKAGENGGNKDGMGDPKKPPENGGEKGMSENKTPPKPGDNKDPMGGNGPMQDPKADPNQPGEAKGQPKNQNPNGKKAGNPNDPNAKPPEQKPGEGGEGTPKPDNSAQQGTSKTSPPRPKDGNGGDQANNQQKQDDPGAAKPHNTDPKGTPKPSDQTKSEGGKPGDAKPGKAGDPKDAAGDPKPADNKNPMGQGEVAKAGEPKGDKGNQNADPNKPDGSGGMKDVADAADKAKNGNPQEKQAAKEKLGQMAKNNPDQKTRDAAKEALKKADDGQGGDQGVAKKAPEQPKAGDPMAPKQEPVADNKTKPGDPSQTGAPKPGDASNNDTAQKSEPKDSKTAKTAQEPKGDAKSQPKPSDAASNSKPSKGNEPGQQKGDGKSGGSQSDTAKAGESKSGSGGGGGSSGGMKDPMVAQNPPMPAGPMGNNPSGDPMGQGKGQGTDSSPATAKTDGSGPGQGKKSDEPGPGGSNPGQGGNRQQQVAGNSGDEKRGTITGPDEAAKAKSHDLDIEKLDKEKLKKIYEKYGLPPGALEEYAKQQQAKKAAQAAEDKKNTVAADRGDGSKSHLNQGAKRVEGNVDPNAEKLNSGNSGQAPPEYREAAEKFAEQVGKDAARPKKK